MTYNWFYITLCGIVPAIIIIGMAAVLLVTYIREKIEKKRRDKRCHRQILNWWELTVK